MHEAQDLRCRVSIWFPVLPVRNIAAQPRHPELPARSSQMHACYMGESIV
jgi:hypothetical protein